MAEQKTSKQKGTSALQLAGILLAGIIIGILILAGVWLLSPARPRQMVEVYRNDTLIHRSGCQPRSYKFTSGGIIVDGIRFEGETISTIIRACAKTGGK